MFRISLASSEDGLTLLGWRRSMTVCVGTIAQNGRAIVMLADKAATVSTMQADTNVRKILPIGTCGWYAMTAGDPTFAEDVIEKAKSKIEEDQSIPVSLPSMMTCMKEAYQACRENHLVDEILTPNLLDKTSVVARPATLLPLQTSHYLKVVEDIARFKTRTRLLVCGFDKGKKPKPHIFSVQDPGIYLNHDSLGYWAIGIGDETALSHLLSMATSKKDEIPEALYQAFDAKVKSEIRQGIGYDSDAEILVAGRNKSIPVPHNIIELLDRVYSAFPLSPFDQHVERSPKDWHIKMWRFSRKIFPKSKMPSVIYFRSKPPMTSKKSRRAGAQK
jgi:20S proteasome alpha/beta subunit